MFDIYPTDWPVTARAADPRNEFHARALHEARMTTDVREAAAPERGRRSVVARLRHAITGAPAMSAGPCTCPA